MVKQSIGKSPEKSDSNYKGVRKRKWGKWVSEIRLPNSRERIWLGSYDSAVKAARAFDAAVFCLRGGAAKFNFPDNPPNIAGGHSLTPSEIQSVAAEFANSEPPTNHSDSSPSHDSSSSASQSRSDDSFWNLDNAIESSYSDLNLDSFPECDVFFDDLYSNFLPQTGCSEDFFEGMMDQESFLWNF